MATLENITLIVYAKTPAAAVTAPKWDFKCYQGIARTVQLFDGQVAGPDVQTYPSFVDFTWTPMYPRTVRTNSFASFTFTMVSPTAISSSDTLVITLPAAANIALPANSRL
jgi:hypothetical protein